MADYYAHLPVGDLRDLLDIKSQLGEPFTDAQAAADLGLDLDRLTHTNKALRLGKLHSRRFYAQRWGWNKTRVQDAFAGDERRGVPPWIEKAARKTTGRYSEPNADDPATTGDHSADSGDQKAAFAEHKKPIRDHSADSGDHSADKEEQYLQYLQKGDGVPRERDPQPLAPRPSGAAYAEAAVAAYAEAVGDWPAPLHAAAIARALPGLDPARALAFAEHVTTWAVSPTRNARNVPAILQSFDEHLARNAPPAIAHRGARRGGAGRNAASDVDPADAYSSIRDAVRGAAG